MAANADRTPMTEEQARAVIEEMRAETKPAAQIKMIRLALGPLGNLTEGAKSIYSARLAELTE